MKGKHPEDNRHNLPAAFCSSGRWRILFFLLFSHAHFSLNLLAGNSDQPKIEQKFEWAEERVFLAGRTSARGPFDEYPQAELFQIHELLTEQYDLSPEGTPIPLWIPPNSEPETLYFLDVITEVSRSITKTQGESHLIRIGRNDYQIVTVETRRFRDADGNGGLPGWYTKDGEIVRMGETYPHYWEFPRLSRKPRNPISREKFVELLKAGHQFHLVMEGVSRYSACPKHSRYIRVKDGDGPLFRAVSTQGGRVVGDSLAEYVECPTRNRKSPHRETWVIYRVKWL